MNKVESAFQEQLHALWATLACFITGMVTALIVLWGTTRPFSGADSLLVPVALISGLIAAIAFLISSYLHRHGETQFMPSWQKAISHSSFLAVTIAVGGVTGLGALLAGHLMGSGLPGLQLGAVGGSLIAGVVAAFAGWLAFQAGIDLSTRDLATLLFTFLVIGTVFAMVSQGDPTWWQRNFSQLGIGSGAWAFNGTLIIAGLLVATIGSYIGRDLHRMLQDDAVPKIARVVIIWVVAGIALAGVGWYPLDQRPVAHSIAAFAALGFLLVAAGVSQASLSRRPLVLIVVTYMLIVLVGAAVLLTFWVPILSVTALESIVVGLALLWMTTFIRVLGILAPNRSVASQRRHLLATKQPDNRHRETNPVRVSDQDAR